MRRVFATIGLPALALTCMLGLPGASFAQHHGGHWGGGHWGAHYGGWGHRYYGGWGGLGHRYYGGWGGWGHRYYGGGWGYPGYYWGGYSAPYYYSTPYYSTPYYYSMPYYSYSPMISEFYGTQPTGSVATDSNRAYVHVRVPADARLTFDNTPMTETGTDRTFVTPPLDTNRNYSYHITAKWMDHGRQVNEERMVRLIPGQTVDVDFTATSNAAQTNPIR
jgi:uncharacterized protein (TIGR03000 family)